MWIDPVLRLRQFLHLQQLYSSESILLSQVSLIKLNLVIYINRDWELHIYEEVLSVKIEMVTKTCQSIFCIVFGLLSLGPRHVVADKNLCDAATFWKLFWTQQHFSHQVLCLSAMSIWIPILVLITFAKSAISAAFYNYS